MGPLKRDFSEGRFRLIYTCTFQRKITELVQIIFGCDCGERDFWNARARKGSQIRGHKSNAICREFEI